jgi:hypothetical protein
VSDSREWSGGEGRGNSQLTSGEWPIASAALILILKGIKCCVIFLLSFANFPIFLHVSYYCLAAVFSSASSDCMVINTTTFVTLFCFFHPRVVQHHQPLSVAGLVLPISYQFLIFQLKKMSVLFRLPAKISRKQYAAARRSNH